MIGQTILRIGPIIGMIWLVRMGFILISESIAEEPIIYQYIVSTYATVLIGFIGYGIYYIVSKPISDWYDDIRTNIEFKQKERQRQQKKTWRFF